MKLGQVGRAGEGGGGVGRQVQEEGQEVTEQGGQAGPPKELRKVLIGGEQRLPSADILQ